jgi:hypothetical protein
MISIERGKFGTAGKKFALITDVIFFSHSPPLVGLGWQNPSLAMMTMRMNDSIRGQGFANIRFRSGHESLLHGFDKAEAITESSGRSEEKGKRLRRVE